MFLIAIEQLELIGKLGKGLWESLTSLIRFYEGLHSGLNLTFRVWSLSFDVYIHSLKPNAKIPYILSMTIVQFNVTNSRLHLPILTQILRITFSIDKVIFHTNHSKINRTLVDTIWPYGQNGQHISIWLEFYYSSTMPMISKWLLLVDAAAMCLLPLVLCMISIQSTYWILSPSHVWSL